MENQLEPKFSIGVTTYNRIELLRECIQSIIAQTCGDFEIIIGNDFVASPIAEDNLEIRDPRVRIINWPVNLGEIGNMNALLQEARGKYFTWLADDDLYHPDFLQNIQAALSKCPGANCVFTNFSHGPTTQEQSVPASAIELIEGRAFLDAYVRRAISTIGCYGMFEINYLKGNGGIHKMGSGFSPYADNFMVVQASGEKLIPFVRAPLLHFRTHSESQSFISTDLEAYFSAQDDFLRKSVEIFKSPTFSGMSPSYVFYLIRWCMGDFFSVVSRRRPILPFQMFRFLKIVNCHVGAAGLYGPVLYIHFLKYMLKTFFVFFKVQKTRTDNR